MFINFKFGLNTISVLRVGTSRAFVNGSGGRLNGCVVCFLLCAIAGAISHSGVQVLVANGPGVVGIAGRILLCFATEVSVVRMNMSCRLGRRFEVVEAATHFLVGLLRALGVRVIGGDVRSTSQINHDCIFVGSL